MSDDLRRTTATVSTMMLVRSTFDAMPSTACLAMLAMVTSLPFTAAFAQDAAAPDPATGNAAPGAVDEAGDAEGEAGDGEDRIDPRTEAAQDEARQIRIRRLTDVTSTLPTEGDLLTSFGIPAGLVGDRGLGYGRFILLPSLTLGAIYTDNADASEDDPVEELSANAVGSVRAQSLLARHEFGLNANVTSGYSFQNENDDYLDWVIGADGRLDLTRKSSVFGDVSYSRETEDDSSAEAEGEANDIHSINGGTGYRLTGNKFTYQLGLSAQREEFSGEESADRDNTTYGINQILQHQTTERLTLFVTPQYSYTAFDEDTDDDGEGRDTQSITGLVGADFAFRSPVNVSAAVGYTRLIEDSNQDDTDSVVANGGLSWQATPLTSLNLSASHTLELTTVDGADATRQSELAIGSSHQIGSSMALSGEVTGTFTDFEGLSRNDYDLAATLGLARRLADNVFLSLIYQFDQRLSTDDDVDQFNTNSVALGLSLIY